MYKSYENNSSASDNMKYEEKIIPEEINENLKQKNNKKNSISGNSIAVYATEAGVMCSDIDGYEEYPFLASRKITNAALLFSESIA